jgi:hypothetical protein
MATKTNMIVDQGATFSVLLTIRNAQGQTYDLTGGTVTAYFKKSYGATTGHAFTTLVTQPYAGQVLLQATDEETSQYEPGRYVYDVVVTDKDGKKFRAIEGQLTVTPGVILSNTAL